MFKIGDVVTLNRSENNGTHQMGDVGKPARILSRGSMFEWRIRMLHRVNAVHGDYDWGADSDQLEYARGPW